MRRLRDLASLLAAAALAGCTSSPPADAIVAPTSDPQDAASGNATGNGTAFAAETGDGGLHPRRRRGRHEPHAAQRHRG